MVAFMHCTLFASERLGGIDVWLAGGHGVGIFFVISGFVMQRASVATTWRTFVARRAARIVPLYWLATALKLSLVLAVPALAGSVPDAAVVAKSFLFLPALNEDSAWKPLISAGWTLNVEMFFYAVVALGLAFRVRLVPLLGTVLIGCFAISLWPNPQGAWTLYATPLMLDFLAGFLTARYLTGCRIDQVTAWLMTGVGAAALLMCPPNLSPAAFVFMGVVPAALLVWGVVALEPYIHGRVPRWVLFCGEASFALYLVHTFVAPAAPIVFAALGPWFAVLAGTGTSILAAAVVHVKVERPISHVLRGRREIDRPRGSVPA